jgi:hypothetical protein
MSQAVAQVLRDALGLVEKEGWTKGTLRDAQGQRCMTGAVYDGVSWAFDGLDLEWEALDALIRVIGDKSVSHWNDAPERTLDEVLAAFKTAIIAEEGKS